MPQHPSQSLVDLNSIVQLQLRYCMVILKINAILIKIYEYTTFGQVFNRDAFSYTSCSAVPQCQTHAQTRKDVLVRVTK